MPAAGGPNHDAARARWLARAARCAMVAGARRAGPAGLHRRRSRHRQDHRAARVRRFGARRRAGVLGRLRGDGDARGRSARSTTSPSTRAASWPSRTTAAANGIACSSPSSTCSPKGRRWRSSKTSTGPTRRRSICCATPAGASPARVRSSSRAYRNDEVVPAHPLRAVLGDLATAGAPRLAPQPLSLAAVQSLSAGTGVDAAALHEQTAGNPFFVTEVLAATAKAMKAFPPPFRTRCWRAPGAYRPRPVPCSTRPQWPGRVPRPGCCAS